MVATHSGQQSLDLDLREQALASIPRLSGDKVAVAFQLTGARQSLACAKTHNSDASDRCNVRSGVSYKRDQR